MKQYFKQPCSNKRYVVGIKKQGNSYRVCEYDGLTASQSVLKLLPHSYGPINTRSGMNIYPAPVEDNNTVVENDDVTESEAIHNSTHEQDDTPTVQTVTLSTEPTINALVPTDNVVVKDDNVIGSKTVHASTLKQDATPTVRTVTSSVKPTKNRLVPAQVEQSQRRKKRPSLKMKKKGAKTTTKNR